MVGDADGDLAIAFDIGSATTIQSILTSIDGVGGITVGILARQGQFLSTERYPSIEAASIETNGG